MQQKKVNTSPRGKGKGRGGKGSRQVVPNSAPHNPKASAPSSTTSPSSSSVDPGALNINGSVTSTKSANKTSTLIYRLAKHWMHLPTQVIGIVGPSIILILLGINAPPQSIPLLNFIQQHRIAALVVGCILALITLLAVIITYEPSQQSSSNTPVPSAGRPDRRLVIAMTISTTSFLLSSALLVIVLVRPSWCPSQFCPSVLPIVPQGVSDGNISLYNVDVQSSSFVIPGDPAVYYQQKLPQSIGAVRIIDKMAATSSPYRVVLGVQNLLSDRRIDIEQIMLVLKKVPPIPPRLNVWTTTPSKTYNNNSFLVAYRGERAGGILFISPPASLVSLGPDEPDQFNVQVTSRVPVRLQFSVQIAYHISNDSKLHTLELPQIFEVVLSDASNWHEYRLQDGRFVAQS